MLGPIFRALLLKSKRLAPHILGSVGRRLVAGFGCMFHVLSLSLLREVVGELCKGKQGVRLDEFPVFKMTHPCHRCNKWHRSDLERGEVSFGVAHAFRAPGSHRTSPMSLTNQTNPHFSSPKFPPQGLLHLVRCVWSGRYYCCNDRYDRIALSIQSGQIYNGDFVSVFCPAPHFDFPKS
jgi:hypothetical protein